MAVDDEAIGLGGRLDFLCHFVDLPDPRQAIKVRSPLDEVLLLTLCAVICGADGWAGVSLFGKPKLSFLRRFLPFANGAPSHDQLGLIFGALDAAACEPAWRPGAPHSTSQGPRLRKAPCGANSNEPYGMTTSSSISYAQHGQAEKRLP